MAAATTDPGPTSSPPRRRYDSPLRAQQAAETKARIIGAATELFTTRGWAGTGMRDVARRAGWAGATARREQVQVRGVDEPLEVLLLACAREIGAGP